MNLPALFRSEGLFPISKHFENMLKQFTKMDSPLFEFGTDLIKSGYPKIDIIDEDEKVVVRAELAGVEKKDIKVEYKDNLLTITAEKKEEKKYNKTDYIHQELRSGKVCRQIVVPNDYVEPDKISALFMNGVLTVEIPKKEDKVKKEKKYDINIS